MVAAHMPEAAGARYNGHEGNRGEGIMLGARLGGALADMGSYQGYAMLTDPQAISVPPGVIIDGGVIVNGAGARFVDEMADIAGMVHQIMAQPDGLGWVIFDDRIAQACAYIPEMVTLGALNAAKTGATAEDLAAAIRVDPAVLAATLADATQAFHDGRADAVGRAWTAQCPPPVAPYHAFRVGGAIYHTQGGLQTDAVARVLRADGSALPNLFARRVWPVVMGLSARDGFVRGGDYRAHRRLHGGCVGRVRRKRPVFAQCQEQQAGDQQHADRAQQRQAETAVGIDVESEHQRA
jgi:fumarate reductase flavoprotein subunit